MRLFILMAVIFIVTVFTVQNTYALRPVSTATLYGKVHDRGDAVRHILVQVMIGHCFSPIVKVLSTNESGFYRVDGLPAGQPIHIGLNGFRAHGALNKSYKATCAGKGIKLRAGQLNRHNMALERIQTSTRGSVLGYKR